VAVPTHDPTYRVWIPHDKHAQIAVRTFRHAMRPTAGVARMLFMGGVYEKANGFVSRNGDE